MLDAASRFGHGLSGSITTTVVAHIVFAACVHVVVVVFIIKIFIVNFIVSVVFVSDVDTCHSRPDSPTVVELDEQRRLGWLDAKCKVID